MPQTITLQPTCITQQKDSILSWDGDALIEKFLPEFFEELKAHGVSVPQTSHLTDIPEPVSGLVSIENDEAYALTIDADRIWIQGRTEKGIFYGIQTLYQLFTPINSGEAKGSYMLPQVSIIDYPIMGIRGVSDDHSRGQVGTVASVKKFIRFLSRFKMNVFQFYWEDMYRFDAYPMIGRDRGAWTKEEVKEAEKYAQEHCVDLYPILNSLGHMETYFWNPDLKHLGEFPGSACIDVSNPKSYEFLDTLFTEIGTTFESTSFHIGADESRQVGFYNSKALVEKEGLGKLYLKHYKFCIDKLVSLGKKRIFLYSDVAAKYKEVLEGLPREDAIFVMWDYEAREEYPRLRSILEHKLPFIVSSSAIDYNRIFPMIDQSIETNLAIIGVGLKEGGLGQINSSWGNNGNESFRDNRLHSFAVSSSMSWNFDTFDKKIFTQAFFKELFGIYIPEMGQLWEKLSMLNEIMASKLDMDPYGKFFATLWRHPFARWEHAGEELDMASIDYSETYGEEKRGELNEMLSLMNQISKVIQKNSINLDTFRYAVDSCLLFIDRIQAVKKIDRLEKQIPLDIGTITDVIVPLRDKYTSMRADYERLWMACAKRPRLDVILRYFDWVIFWYEEKLAQIANGVGYRSPMLLGDWIVHDDGDNKTNDSRFFRHQFSISEPELEDLQKAQVQMIPASYGILWINGVEIGRAPGNPNSTELPLDMNWVFAELKKDILKVGDNLIEIEARVWPDGWPVANLNLHLAFNSGKPRLICTDRTWKSSISREGPWQRIRSMGRAPRFMKEIYVPNWEKGWPSASIIDNFGGLVMSIATNKAPITKWFVFNWSYTNLFM